MPSHNPVSAEDKVCILIPTYCRPAGLRAAIESLFLKSAIAPHVRIVVVDNNPEATEEASVAKLSKEFSHEIDYIHEPNSGLSNARNAAMSAVEDSRFVAFLNDDMTVSENWLSALIATSKSYNAGLVFGPTYAVMPQKDDLRNRYMEPFFERVIDKADDGLTQDLLGTGGCLLDLTHCNLPNPTFNPDYNEKGGEDDIFFDHLKQTGSLVAWSTKAISYEMVPASRATSEYIWKRNFGYGQGPVRIHASRGVKGILGIVYFMIAGALQLLVYGPNLVVRMVLSRPSQTKYLALTARAVGKIFWSDKLSPLLYGKSNS